MKNHLFKINVLFLALILLVANGCDKEDDLPANHAKGEIVGVTTRCGGQAIIIEVTRPKNIGHSATFDDGTKYNNLVGVPYFSKIDLPDTIPGSIGTKLYFEYREVTDEELDLFKTIPAPLCPLDYIPYSYRKLIITKVISYN